MTPRQAFWTLLMAGAVMRSAWVLVSLGTTPTVSPTAPQMRQIPSPRQERPVSVRTEPYWHDPSVDPEILKKAYAPPPSDLPREALPYASNIEPDAEAWGIFQKAQDPLIR